MKTGLVIVTKDRPEYLRRCLDSLRKADLEGVEVICVDDWSHNSETQSILFGHLSEYLPVAKVCSSDYPFGPLSNIKGALLTGFEDLIDCGCDFLINLDSDAIVTPDFVQRLEALCDNNQEYGTSGIISGFNNGRDVVESDTEFTLKKSANGINMAFDKDFYFDFVKPILSNPSVQNWDWELTKDNYCTITKPSCVQHIGYKSSMGHDGDVDLAIDFPPTLHLPDVTLFGIDSHDPQGLLHAAKESQRDIAFGSYRIITDDLFTPGGTTEQRREDYSRFCIKELGKQFHTSHVLIIHADGWVVNPLAWRDEWLQYDYIGAPWWFHTDEYRVGNGGFSLRSKKLCDYLAAADIEHIHPEDHHICRTYRAALEAEGFKFAPEAIASQFSVEGQPYRQQFGFHGKQVDFTGADIARVPFGGNRLIDPIEAAERARRKRSDRWKK